MSGLVLRLCECRVGLLGKAANNNYFFNQQVICQASDQSWPDQEAFWWDKKQNKRKNEEKNEQVKAKN